jgi:nicotinamide-nucleotide amidase
MSVTVNINLVIDLLIKKGLTVACAESCTGGLLASRFIDWPGASAVFLEGAVTYSNEAKMRRLNVSPGTLQKYGAVSSQTAAEMARGIAMTSGAAIGLATTGIAGPDGGSADKPVGLVFISYHNSRTGETIARQLNLSGARAQIRAQAVDEAINLLYEHLTIKNKQ